MNTSHALNHLIHFVRQHSRYYATHLQHVAYGVATLSELPVVDPQQYWQTSQNLEQWPVLTAAIDSALVFKTGGTTSTGKLSVFTRQEWQTLAKDFGNQLTSQLEPGDRVANLFFVGDLYASFIFIHDALAHETAGVTEYPFTGHVESSVLAESIVQQRINVLAGVPAHLLSFADWLHSHSRILDCVDTLLYGGESLFATQLPLLRRVFPNARFASIGYASVDAGFIGATARDCALGEHRMLERHSVLEILDEQTGEVIDACGVTGRLVVTNLTRRLMPLIRYPVGDLACWREPAGVPMRKFALQGRSANSSRVRVGSLTLMTDDIDAIVRRITGGDDWQLLIGQADTRDVLTLKWLSEATNADTRAISAAVHAALVQHYPLIAQLRADRRLELLVEGCRAEDLSRHPRSGKRQRLRDLRRYEAPGPEQRPWTT
ncbi:AMP-binding protein [Pseudomonas sp. WC2]|uniref:AMP-binding protein n=1 Tax=Pseudomonas sp. WC2 TaxID=3424773 RepID=UPI003D34B819